MFSRNAVAVVSFAVWEEGMLTARGKGPHAAVARSRAIAEIEIRQKPVYSGCSHTRRRRLIHGDLKQGPPGPGRYGFWIITSVDFTTTCKE